MKVQPIKFNTGKLTLEPGDIVVLMANGPITEEIVHAVKRQMKYVTKKHKCIVLGHGLKIGKISQTQVRRK